MRLFVALITLLWGASAAAQQGTMVPLEDTSGQGQIIELQNEGAAVPDVQAEELRAQSGIGAMLKGLDKVSGDILDVELAVGDSTTVGRLNVELGDCRYPEDNITGEGYAWLTITDPTREAVLFDGWMVASSPALNALDHPRYDVWVIRCTKA